jgi:hypothetical protein
MYRGATDKFDGSCPICEELCQRESDQSGTTLVTCPTCGRFRFGTGVELFFDDRETRKFAYKLSHYFRSISERALGQRDNSFFPIYADEELEKVIEGRDPSVREKLQLLLRHLAGLSDYPGEQIRFDATHDYSVLCAKNEEEAIFYLDSLLNQGLVTRLWLMGTGNEADCALTSAAWQELERIEQSGSDSSDAFIAMWFDSSQNAVNKAIQSAVTDAGYVPIRIDEVEHVNRIDDEIIARIRRSKFLVADFTGQRNGVYFEAGFMLGLGRPVIWLCNESDLEKVHFDTRQYNTIAYSDFDELRSKLQFRIEAIMGKGPQVKDELIASSAKRI